jgi:hypothetical protein
VATTAVTSFYCGGCATLGTGALLGELTGGMSALSRGGDPLAGTAVGGAAGLAAAGISGPITGSLADQMVLGGLRGAVQGGAFGAVGAWAGGKGSVSEMKHGALIGGIAGGVIGAMTPAVLGRNIAGDPDVRMRLEQIRDEAQRQGLNLDLSQMTVREGALPQQLLHDTHYGLTLGNDTFYMNPAQPNWAQTLAHEAYHAISWQQLGWQYTAQYMSNPDPWEAAANQFGSSVFP